MKVRHACRREVPLQASNRHAGAADAEKFEHYMKVPSLAAVVYVSRDQRLIEVRACSAGTWKAHSVGEGETATISAPGIAIDVDALYADAGA